ncbi:hypothetical protein BDW02DRAFT_609034 [Decorospora gaudefroyi]|uniref:Uncharacterized protein n=1 Tax=Decorospora gaudefroyi TaxID=184978 RepID=A0A6A5K0U5_9PLEO|nr:hypothetical protein BDW02DRAFT_609034 [Decorospora gaudefroyi]
MSPSPNTTRLAILEAQAQENESNIDQLTHTNWLLRNHATLQQTTLTKLKQDFETEFPHFHIHIPDTPTPAPVANTLVPHEDEDDHPHHQQHTPRARPDPRPTPFYIAVRGAPALGIEFVIPGFRGETLGVGVDIVDLAFVLQQGLRRRGWGEVMTQKGVEDFLAWPVVEVKWRGREGELGRLCMG